MKLSICIATFNRADFIGETLDSLIAQLADDVEVIVVDGASTDGTAAVVGEYAARCPQLRYVRLEKKGGVDQDFARAVELAAGDYCWLMSDDDVVKPGAIQAVLAAADRGYGLILVNSEVRDRTLSEVLHERELHITADREYAPEQSSELFRDVAQYMSFIGCVVIRRSVWESRDKARYFGTAFVHVGVVFQAPLPLPALVIAEPYIAIRYGNAQWTSRYFEIWMIKWPELLWSFEHIPAAIRAAVYPREPWRLIRTLLLFRAKGAYSRKDYETWVEPRLRGGLQRFMSSAVARAPGGIVNLLAVGYYRLRAPSARATILDLTSSPFFLFGGRRESTPPAR